jgi:hypothetical protein
VPRLGNTAVPVYWYGLLFASTFALGTLFMMFVFRREHRPLDQVYDLQFHIMIGTVVGSRLFHILFLQPRLLFRPSRKGFHAMGRRTGKPRRGSRRPDFTLAIWQTFSRTTFFMDGRP